MRSATAGDGHPVPDPFDLAAIGFAGRWPALLAGAGAGAEPGRVVRDDRGSITVLTATGERSLPVAHGVVAVTGDWVAVSGDTFTVLERATAIVRPRSGDGRPQVLAANVDYVGVVHGLDRSLNRRRLERGLVLAWESGAIPVVVLTKADVAGAPDAARAEAAASAPGADVLVVSVVDGRGLDEVRDLVAPGHTLALIGASGAGKSSLVNALVGEQVLDTGDVRAGDAKGRHTTTHRELVCLPGGGALLDTPGLRALALGAVEEGVSLAFPEIDELAATCRFDDCGHQREPGCAVLEAVATGSLPADRYEGWRRIVKEVANADLRADQQRWRAHNRQWGRMSREVLRLKADGK